jgi:branched-chain amino acid transport system permease protein
MPLLSTDRLNFYYRTQGTADGLPVLLVHGSYASSRWWEPLLAVLPAELQVVAPDLRGMGGSDKPEGGYTVEAQAEDLWALVQGLNWQGFDLVAHAAGGAIAVEFTLTHPECVRSLILVDSVPVEGVFTPLDMLLVLKQMRVDRALLAQALALLMPTYDRTLPDHAAFFAQLVDDAAAMAPAAFTGIAESLGRWNRFAAAKRLTLPTLLLWGDQDTIIPREALTRTLIAIPGALNLAILHGVGHSPMIEAPLTLAEKIVDFITEDFAHFAEVRASVANE